MEQVIAHGFFNSKDALLNLLSPAICGGDNLLLKELGQVQKIHQPMSFI
jgi:hypothetical protein